MSFIDIDDLQELIRSDGDAVVCCQPALGSVNLIVSALEDRFSAPPEYPQNICATKIDDLAYTIGKPGKGALMIHLPAWTKEGVSIENLIALRESFAPTVTVVLIANGTNPDGALAQLGLEEQLVVAEPKTPFDRYLEPTG